MKIIKKINEENPVLINCKKKDDYVLMVDEEDITSVYLLENVSPWILNYAELKDCYQYLGKNFSNLNDDDKSKIIDHCAVDKDTCITYYVSKGLSNDDALNLFISNRCAGITKLIEVCNSNIKNNRIFLILLSYMDQENAEKFLEATHQLVYNYTNFAVYGKKYGNYIDGILDYIEDYGAFSGNGLSTYVLYPGKLLSDLVSELVSLLTNNRSNIV